MNINKEMVILSGFSGAGKSTIVKELLLKEPRLKLVKSYTTREPRKDSGDYYVYVSPEEFLKMELKNQFLESVSFSGNSYGTPIKEVEEIWDLGCIPLLEIDTLGYEKIKEKLFMKGVLIRSIFVVVSGNEMYSRLLARGTESIDKIISRMKIAVSECDKIYKYDLIVENANIDLTGNTIMKYISTGDIHGEQPDIRKIKESIKEKLEALICNERGE